MMPGGILAISRIVWLKMLRRKDAYVLVILMGALLAVLTSMDIFGLGGFVRYAVDIGLLMSWVFSVVLAVTISAREIPDEERDGTVLTLLAKPLSRWGFIFGKWIGVWVASCAATVLFYGVVCIVALVMGEMPPAGPLLQGIILHFAALSILCALGLALSTRLNHDAAVTLSFAVAGVGFLLLPRIPAFLLNAPGEPAHTVLLLLYHALPHLDFFDMRLRIVHHFDPLPALVFLKVMLHGVFFTTMFLMLTWMSYRRKLFLRRRLM